jgi:hypothetical protein
VLGLINSLKIFKREAPIQYIKDGLKLYMPYKKNDTVQFVGEGSTSFDGTNDYVDCGADSSFEITDAITCSAWVNCETIPITTGLVICKDDDSGDKAFNISLQSSAINWRIYDGGTAYTATYSTGIVDNTWHHLCGTYDGSNLKLYVDGVLQATQAHSGDIDAESGEKVFIGQRGDGARFFDGNICQVGIWSSALTQAQIQSIMEKTYAELTASEKEDLVSWWGLDSTVTNDANFNSSAFVVDEHDTTFGNNITPTWSVGVGSATIDGQVIILPEAGTNSVAGSVGSAGVFKVNVTITNYTGSGSIEMPWNGSGSSNMQITANGTYEYYENTNSSTLYIYAVDGRGCTTTVNSIVKADGNMGDLL